MKNKKTVIFMGAKDIGFECLKYLFNNLDFLNIKIEGVLTNERGIVIKQYCEQNNIHLIENLNEYLNLNDFNILISVQYHQILKKIHINKATEIAINLHMAPLPEYRGCNQFSFAIINGDKVFGTTIHKLEEGVDSGSIIFENRFEIPENCFVKDLYDLTFDKSIELFKANIKNIIDNNYELTPQKEFLNIRKTEVHFRKEINDIKEIDYNWEKEKIMRYIRAVCMPGFEPPHLIIGNKKIKLIIEQ